MKSLLIAAVACCAVWAGEAWAQTATSATSSPSTSTSTPSAASTTSPTLPSAAGSTRAGTVGSDVQRIGPATDLQQRDPLVGPSQFYDRYDDTGRRRITIDDMQDAGRVMQPLDDLDPGTSSRGERWLQESRLRGRRSATGDDGFTVYGTDDARWTQDPRLRDAQQPGTVGETVLGERRDARAGDGAERGGRSASLFILQPASMQQFDARRPEEAALPLDARLGDGQQIMVIGTVIDPARPVQFASEIRQIARIGTDGGQIVLIDLGRGEDQPTVNLRPGERLTVIGGADRIDNRLTVRATHVGRVTPVR